MDTLSERLKALSSAEDFLAFFAVPFDRQVVQVNRQYILKRFTQYLQKAPDLAGLDEVGMYRRYRALLTQAYKDFVRGTPHVGARSLHDSLQRAA